MLRCLLLLLCLKTSLSAQRTVLEKCSPLLRQEALEERDMRSDKALYTVQVNDWPDFKKRIAIPGVRVVAAYPPSGVLVIECSEAFFWSVVLPQSIVVFADIAQMTANEEIIVPGHNLFANQIRCIQAKRPGLDGRGTVISIKEFAFDTSDVDFRNRILPNPQQQLDIRVHATIMATLAAGGGNADPAGGGVAKGGRLYSSSFAGLLPDTDADYEGNEIRVQNHSYGSGIQNYYGANALAYDQTTLDHPELVHIFSAGNEGGATAPTGVYANVPGFANLTGNYKMAKNVLTVGAIDSFNIVPVFSSRGPAYDGRLKPDMVAYGADGTSGAAAVVSGAAAVVQQAFFEKFGYWPGSDLVKAVLLGSADDLNQVGPDFTSGYGSLNLFNAIELVENRIMATGTVSTGESQMFILSALPSNLQNLKITLHWNDVPAPANTAKALVNDLDIQLITPDGSVQLPWLLQSQPDATSLTQPAGRGVDTLNNTEQVVVQSPVPGTYLVKVIGKSVAAGMQSFGIVANWDTLQHLVWTCPVKRDPCTAGKEVILRWETNITGASGRLAWRVSGTNNWQEIDTAVNLQAGYFRWMAPDTFTAAQVRIEVGEKTVDSDTFLIAPVLRAQVGFNCPDSLLIVWKNIASAALYRVWGLGDQYLEPLLLTADTAIVFPKSVYLQQRFAVSAISSGGGAEGPVSSAPDIDTQGAGCYISNLLAQLNAAQQVGLTVQLGSLYGVKKVIIDQFRQQEWQQLAMAFPVSNQLFFLDPAPIPGVNTYRVRLVMDNGETILGESVNINFAGDAGIVFPNPAQSWKIVVLFEVAEEPRRFILRDIAGHLILEKGLDDTRTDLSIASLVPGYYFWEVVGIASERLSGGKILVLR